MRIKGTKNKKSYDYICEFCRKSFVTFSKRAKYCSQICNQRNWIKNNRERKNTTQRKYYKTRIKESRKYQNEYYQKYIEKHRQYNKIWARERTARFREEIFAKYGDKCKKCGFPDKRALQVDHINGGGGKEFRLQEPYAKARRTLYKKILEDNTGKYQILCANCNWIKRFENNEMRRID